MAVYEFKVSDFRAEFPAFADDTKYPDTTITQAYNVVVSFFQNTDSSVFPYDPENGDYTRKRLIDFGVCHLLTLDDQPMDQPGRIASASEGSVSTSFDLMNANSTVGDWWTQTKCGRLVWVLLAPFIYGGRIYVQSKFHPWG